MASSIDHATARRAFDEHFDRFEEFVRFFCALLQRPDPLRDAECRESYREYVPRYYRPLFGPGVDGPSRRHLTWLRRLAPVLALPPGASVLDCGGGYGLDTILLAACGYDVVFFELSPHHIAVCEFFRRAWEQRFGPLRVRCVLASPCRDRGEAARADAAAIGSVDAMLLNEVAHHVEPVDDLFALAAAVLPPGGHLFLLEPNFWSPLTQAYFFRARGFRTVEVRVNRETGEARCHGNEHLRRRAHWQRLAVAAGFRPSGAVYVVPYMMHSRGSASAAWRTALESVPIVKTVAATHLTLRFEKTGLAPASP